MHWIVLQVAVVLSSNVKMFIFVLLYFGENAFWAREIFFLLQYLEWPLGSQFL